ncbi:hypothetical protein MOQ67_05370 [Pseudomonas sp. LY-1]
MIDMKAMSNFFGFSSADSIEYCVVTTNVRGPSIDSELNYKAPCLGAHMHSVYARLISTMPLLVSSVLKLWYVAKIFKAVVRRIPVYMVNIFTWPTAVLVEPRKTVCFPYAAENADPYIASALGPCTHDIASLPAREPASKLVSSCVFKAREYPRFWVVMNVFLKLFLGEHLGTLVKAV